MCKVTFLLIINIFNINFQSAINFSAPICGSRESHSHLVGLDRPDEERRSRLGQPELQKDEEDPHERQGRRRPEHNWR